MSELSVSLFGKLQIRTGGSEISSLSSKKARELLVYLLLHRRFHPRERLGTLLWPHGSTQRAKAYLRKALWKLREAVDSVDLGSPLLLAEEDWVQIHPDLDLWLDVEEFESEFSVVEGVSASNMTSRQVQALEDAVDLYTGDLLENWYRDWCLYERERFRDLLLRMLDRLAHCCEHMRRYERGIKFGLRLLSNDPARESAHRRLMRLRALAGNRTGALRQYERCVEVLEAELGVCPSATTRRLYERIQNDDFPAPGSQLVSPTDVWKEPAVIVNGDDLAGEDRAVIPESFRREEVSLRDGLDRIRRLQHTLSEVQKKIEHEIEIVELALQQRR